MKPQQKVVTAQDVQNSLYYLHAASPNDYELLQEDDCEGRPTKDHPKPLSSLSSTAKIARKPLPENFNPYLFGQEDYSRLEPEILRATHDRSTRNNQTPRKSIDQGLRPEPRNFDTAPQVPPRKVLGPRSMHQRLQSENNVALQNVPERRNVDVRRWSEQPTGRPPQLPVRPQIALARSAQASQDRSVDRFPKDDIPNLGRPSQTGAASAKHHWEWEQAWELRRASAARAEMDEIASTFRSSEETLRQLIGPARATSLSLIRRYNGEQWNVAKIEPSESHTVEFSKPTELGTVIEILTPGYSKYMDPKNTMPDGCFLRAPAHVASVADETVPLRRCLRLRKGLTRPNIQRKSFSSAGGYMTEQSRPSFESYHQSSDSLSLPRKDQTARHPTSPGGFVIDSPWNGICEFSTGVAGRSLKCKHIHSSADPRFGPGSFSTTVSELRFNLPSSKAFGKPNAKSPDSNTNRDGRRSSRFLFSHHRRMSPFDTNATLNSGFRDDDAELEDRLDLSLGQEHAGGGFGGKQAKLGKLIVEVDGLQMLDFVVATNMALWWRVYGRIT